MLSIRSTAAMTRALEMPLDMNLRALLLRRRSQLIEYDHQDIGDLANFIIVQEGDRLDEVEAELGFPVLTNLVDGSRYGEPGYEPSWEWIERHPGWFEAVFVLTDDGFGWVLFVQDAAGIDADLLSLCRSQSSIASA